MVASLLWSQNSPAPRSAEASKHERIQQSADKGYAAFLRARVAAYARSQARIYKPQGTRPLMRECIAARQSNVMQMRASCCSCSARKRVGLARTERVEVADDRVLRLGELLKGVELHHLRRGRAGSEASGSEHSEEGRRQIVGVAICCQGFGVPGTVPARRDTGHPAARCRFCLTKISPRKRPTQG